MDFINFFWQLICNINYSRAFINQFNNLNKITGHVPAPFSDRLYLPTIKEMMKNNVSRQNQGIDWSEFEVVVRNNTHAVRFESRTPGNKVKDFSLEVRNNNSPDMFDTEEILFYMYNEDNIAQMDEFRVKSNNERFGFSVDNPSDIAYREHATR
jgi:hypothetical protein